MGIRAALARLRPEHVPQPPRRTPEAFTVMHSADIDIHLEGVVRPPSAAPPWPSASWGRYDQARRRQPSVMAQVVLDLHPAFAGSPPTPGDLDRAEALAIEWSVLGPTEAAQWLSAHPWISPQQAQTLAEAGWTARDPRLVVPERVVDLAARTVQGHRAAG